MRKSFYAILLILAAFTASCGGTTAGTGVGSDLDHAEAAFNDGRYARAQLLCDSLVLGTAMDTLSVPDRCRLALMFMRLSEISGQEEANAAFALRSLRAAIAADSDSTVVYTRSLPVEDQARIMILVELNESSRNPAINSDSVILCNDEDSVINNYETGH